MSHPGIFAEQVERGLCPCCGGWSCECDAPEAPAWQDRCDIWHDAKTGRIISEQTAKELIAEQRNEMDDSEPPEDYDGL